MPGFALRVEARTLFAGGRASILRVYAPGYSYTINLPASGAKVTSLTQSLP